MANYIKKYWFVSLVVVFLLGIIGYFIYDTNKDILPGKTVNGNKVVYSVNDIDKTADELYEDLYDKAGISIVFSKIQTAAVDQAIETTDEMKEVAKINAANVITNFQNQYGPEYETQLLNALKQLGYESINQLEDYLIQLQKVNQVFSEYVENNPDTTTTPYMEETKPRLVSHILVTMADSANPTEEELNKMKQIEEELEKGTDFKTVAFEYSDDTASATVNGSLGVVNKDTNFVPEFLEAMLLLEENEVSGWVTTAYGKHLIKVDSTSLETLKNEPGFLEGLFGYNPSIQSLAIWDKIEEVGVDFKGNDQLRTELIEYLGIQDLVK